MPEGDSIHTVVRYLGPRLVGETVRSLFVRRHGRRDELAGTVIAAVEARGKNTLIHLEREGRPTAVLHVHLGMNGDWHRYAHGERWYKRRDDAWVVLETSRDVVPCFDPSVADLVRPDALATHPTLSTLGPDLIAEDVEAATLVERARRSPATRRIREVLLDQRIAAGIGNVYKCEVLFIHRLHPDTPVGDVDDGTIAAMYGTASRLLRANVGRTPRITTDVRRRAGAKVPVDDRTWVYERHGRPCRKCVTTIRVEPERGEDRMTWWCPTCQA